MNMAEPSTINENGEDDGLFYFESAQLALKEAQRSKAIQDYEKIVLIEEQALKKPNLFYQKVMKRLDLGIPDFQVIVELPTINWSKYPVELPNEALKFLNSEPIEEKVNTEIPIKDDLEKHSDSTHKKTWSVEEQRRLEELLAIYPTEPVEFRRYKKIAAALGNRTVKQVTSRVQKYFLKLYKAGLPIPGRIPKNAEKARKSKLHMHQRFNHLLFKPSTFFPQLDIPVVMNEAEAVPGPSAVEAETSSNTNYNNYLLPNSSDHLKATKSIEDSKNTLELQVEILKRVKLEKEKERHSGYLVQHPGYKCNYCAEEPLLGTRWHCEVCCMESVDFCSDCVVSQLYSGEPHPMSHELRPYSNETTLENNVSSEYSSDEECNGSNRNRTSSGGSSSTTSDEDDNDHIKHEAVNNSSKAVEDKMEDEQDDSIDIVE